MATENSFERKRSDVAMIATKLNCSVDYVRKVLDGDRKSRSGKAKAIVKAFEIIKEAEKKIDEKIQKISSELENDK